MSIESSIAYIADRIANYLRRQPVEMSSSTDKISNMAPRSVHYKACHACFEIFDKETLVALPCDHYWCRDCLSRACSNVRNDIDKKIRCDAECEVPLEFAVEVLPEAESKRLKSKMQELEIHPRERFYCANRNCGEWIPPVFQEVENLAKCGKCGQSTCKLCRNREHEGECAGPTKEDEQAFTLIEREGYQNCTKCCRVVERTDGCPHMTCYCGYEFCYHCGKQILKCNGCGHLEPDNTPVLARIIEPSAFGPWIASEDASIVENALLSLRIMRRPRFLNGLTSWFNHMLLNDGYHGPTVLLRADRSRVFIIDHEETADPEEMLVSDTMLFREFGTARLQVHADGTGTLFDAEENLDQDENEEEQGGEEEEEEDEGDWNM